MTASMPEYTYGVYLRPDPLTCQAVATLTELVRRQFGLVSSAAFPPHATLVGAFPTVADEGVLIEALDPLLSSTRAIEVHNAGISRHNIAVTFDVDKTRDGDKNVALQDLAIDIHTALDPLRAGGEGHRMKPFDATTFRAHLSLASHDLETLPHLREEVEEFLRALPHAAPSDFVADTVSLFRFHSADWSGEWWHDLRWWHLHTWKLRDLSFAEPWDVARIASRRG